MKSTELKEFEELAEVLANPPNNEAYQKANASLNSFTNEVHLTLLKPAELLEHRFAGLHYPGSIPILMN